jgi:acetamidase/formamidase
MATHYFPTDQVHFTWDTGHAPGLTVADGDTVVFETRDVSDNQIGPGVEGAQPGDTLAIEILDVHTKGWGWTAILPGLGLLADDFTEPYLRVFDCSLGDRTHFREDIVIPLAPFMGTMGVCPGEASAQPVMPPGTFGGNLDTRQLVAGSTLYLPVSVDGALFSTGDAHCCQGDGEICVTGLEAPMYATMRFTVEKRSIPGPQYRTAPGSLTAKVDHGAWFATTGVGGDLFENAQNATRAMIVHLTETYGLSREDAYLLCSLAVDLRISEIVDAGVYVVSALVPEAIFIGHS